jgi:long-chain fatty acid transport protein
MRFTKRKLAAALAVAATVAAPTAFATNGIIQAGNGMVAHGLGGAGLSNASEASAGADNPALISQTGNAVNVAWSMFMPLREFDTTAVPGFGPAGTRGVSDSNMFAIPQAAFTAKASDAISWGVIAYAMGGMNTDYRTGLFPGAGQTDPERVNLQGLIVAPTLSFAFNKNLSVGVAALMAYETLTTRNLFGQGAAGTGEESATGYGVKLGADWKITDGVSVGAIIQPKLSMDELDYFKNFLSGFGFTGDAQLTLPDEYGIGAKFALGKSVDIVADVLVYKWSGVDVFKFFGWEDQTVYKLGAEFRPSEAWALRVGYNYGKSPIKGGNRTENGSMDAAFANYPFPAISEQHYTVGVGYKITKNTTVNAYFLYSPENTETAEGNSQAAPPPAPAVPGGTKISMSQSAAGIGVNVGF